MQKNQRYISIERRNTFLKKSELLFKKIKVAVKIYTYFL